MSTGPPIPEDEDEAAFTPRVRRKAKIQLGDGPDARGEVTIEMERRYPTEPEDDTLDMQFAEWHLEAKRMTRSLCARLGLDPQSVDPETDVEATVSVEGVDVDADAGTDSDADVEGGD